MATYIRDLGSGAVINNDDHYLLALHQRRKSKKESQVLIGELDTLRSELQDLKQQLHNIIGNNKNG